MLRWIAIHEDHLVCVCETPGKCFHCREAITDKTHMKGLSPEGAVLSVPLQSFSIYFMCFSFLFLKYMFKCYTKIDIMIFRQCKLYISLNLLNLLPKEKRIINNMHTTCNNTNYIGGVRYYL